MSASNDAGPSQPAHAHPPGSPAALRALNLERITSLLTQGPRTQAELSRLSGLSAATVSNLVNKLVQEGKAKRENTTSSGRRAHSVSLVDGRDLALGVDIGRRHIRLVAVSRSRTILGSRFCTLPVGHKASETVKLVCREYSRLLKDIQRTESDVVGAGVGLPGPIDRRSQKVIDGTILPEWQGIDLLPLLGSALNTTITLGNDANLGALGELCFGSHSGKKNLIYIKVATGIGAGIISNGSLLTGELGISGEIGHLGLRASDEICTCGNRGCLETVASTRTLLEQLRRAGREVSTSEEIVELAHKGDLACHRFLQDAGWAIGEACAQLANILGPEVILLGGPLAQIKTPFLDSINSSIRRHAVPLIRENSPCEAASLLEESEALGAAELALRRAGAAASSTPGSLTLD